MRTIYGTVGYVFLLSTINNKKILLLSDVHSKLDYCNNFINISDWFYKNIDKVNILLEEVSRDDFKLGELWSESDHTIKLKNLFLNNKNKIVDIDIRPYLIPFSWEIEIDPQNDIFFYKYLDLINNFIYLKHYKIYKKLSNVYNSKYMKKSQLGKHLNEIKIKFKNYILKYNNLLKTKIHFIKTYHKIVLDELNDLLNDCMEWFIIAQVFNIKNNKNIIIHTGLFHSEKIFKHLQQNYSFNIIDIKGINSINEIEQINNYNGCINIPLQIEKILLSE